MLGISFLVWVGKCQTARCRYAYLCIVECEWCLITPEFTGSGPGATFQTISCSKSTLPQSFRMQFLTWALLSLLNWEGLYFLCACRRLKWTGRPPFCASLCPWQRSTLRAQQHLGVNHGELSEYTHTPRLSHGRGPSGASARKLGDGLHWERRGLLYRVRTNCLLYASIRWTFTVTTKSFWTLQTFKIK